MKNIEIKAKVKIKAKAKNMNMKHPVLNWTLVLLMGFTFSHIACAQMPEKRQQTGWAVYDERDTTVLARYVETAYCPHEISLWTAGGVSMLNSRPAFGETTPGFGGAFGVGYTYFWSKNWGLSSGVECSFYQSKIVLSDFTHTCNIVDILGNPIVYQTGLDHYSEKQELGVLNIPLSVQYQTNGNNSFYVSLGGKIGVPVFAEYSRSNAVLTASGYYPDYDQTEIWQNDLGYGVFSLNEKTGKLDLGVSLSGTLETGVKWYIGIGTALYTGVFVDYGMNDMMKSSYAGKRLVEYNRDTPAKPVMNTACVLSERFSPALFGVKMKFVFPAGCHDLLNSRKAYDRLQYEDSSDEKFFDYSPAGTIETEK